MHALSGTESLMLVTVHEILPLAWKCPNNDTHLPEAR
jgi:hypothetical protein